VIDTVNSFLHIVAIGSGYSELRPFDVQIIEHVRKREACEFLDSESFLFGGMQSGATVWRLR
jgi:hypothetical protein